jgi:hypothetical protein
MVGCIAPIQVPIGGAIGRVFKSGDQPVNAQVNAYYNVETPDDTGASAIDSFRILETNRHKLRASRVQEAARTSFLPGIACCQVATQVQKPLIGLTASGARSRCSANLTMWLVAMRKDDGGGKQHGVSVR